jgi:hypothetical protein
MAKTFNRMLLNRIRNKIDPHLRQNQNGFRQQRSTSGQVLALRRIIEEIKNHDLPAVITFIDFKKAFDSINRKKMISILAAYDVPHTIIKAIETNYADTQAKILTPDGKTDNIQITTGVLQGDTLAPYLFIIVLDYVMRRATEGKEEELGFCLMKRRSRRIGPEVVTDLDFADDIALISDSTAKAQAFLGAVEKEAREVGLQINAKKTKAMAFNLNYDFNLTSENGDNIEKVEDFKYLGSWINNTEKDIAVRKALAWRKMHDLKKIWQSKMSKCLKIRTFRATVESTLLYGCESWAMTKACERSLNGTYIRMRRMCQNIN